MLRTFTGIAVVTLCLVAGLISARESEAIGFPKVYTVDTTSDANLTVCDQFTPGDCSLRGAINDANSHANSILGPDSIFFSINPSGIQTITPALPLPAITDAVVVDATGQGSGSDNCGVGKVPCIRLDGSSAGGTVGGLTISAGSVTVRGLAIDLWGGLNGTGIDVTSGSNDTIAGNFIGTADGTTPGANQLGIWLKPGVTNVTIGGTTATDRNLISGNSNEAIEIDGAGTVVEGNYIGTTAAGDGALANNYGVVLTGSNNTIGGASAGAGNVISGSSGQAAPGIWLDGVSGTTVKGNLIGTDVTGTQAVSNGRGIEISNGSNNTIGGADAPSRNVISGNKLQGIILDSSDSGNQIVGNFIGLNAGGTAAIPNQAQGIWLWAFYGSESQHDNVITGNVISGNGDNGVDFLAGGTVKDNKMFGNIIGLNSAGAAAVPNARNGVNMQGNGGTITGNQLGGTGQGQPNVISGNGSDGIAVSDGSTTANSISGNYIGTTADGTQPMGNQQNGISFLGDANGSVKGNTIVSNLISGNEHDGVRFDGAGVQSNGVFHNLIGTDVTGTIPIVTQGDGIGVFGSTNNEFQYNTVVGGQLSVGINLGLGATGNSFRVNYIGTNANGAAGLGGASIGVYINGAPGNEIGTENAPLSVDGAHPESAAGGGNYIWNSLGAGIQINGAAATGNTISGNSIDHNGGLGIRLVAGGNGNAAAPVLTSALTTGGNTEVHGSYTNDPQHDFTAEFFASPACDPSGNGEGRDFLGAATIHTDGSGIATFAATVPGSTAGKAITATVTVPGNGNTSEFSNCVTSAGPTATPSPTPSPTHSPTATPHATPTPTATPSGLKGDANCDGKVDTTDALDTLSQTGGVPPGAACAGRADVNCNGQVDADDALRILDYVAGAPRPQPGGCGPIGFPG